LLPIHDDQVEHGVLGNESGERGRSACEARIGMSVTAMSHRLFIIFIISQSSNRWMMDEEE
jgi:hypothetical protein